MHRVQIIRSRSAQSEPSGLDRRHLASCLMIATIFNDPLGFGAHHLRMTSAIVYARTQIVALPAFEIARAAIVAGCGLTLLLAGRALPF